MSEPNYHAIERFSENLVAIEIRKIKVKMNNPIYLGTTILDISKILMYEFWCGYLKPKYGDKIKLSFLSKRKIFMKMLLMVLKKDLIHQITGLIDLCLKERTKRR